MNIVEVIRNDSHLHLDRIALVEGDVSVTYRVLRERIAAFAKLLRPLGIGHGQRIAFRSNDGIDYVMGVLALLDCGAAVVPIADSLTPGEVVETIERIDVHGTLTHVGMPTLPSDENATPVGERFVWKSRRTDTNALDERCAQIGAAFIRFSSGTTGESKGVVLSHKSIVERTDAANEGLKISEEDVILWVLGMSHHFVVSILLFLRRGATIIVANQNFPFSVLDATKNTKVHGPITFIYASPVHYFLLAMSGAVEKHDLAKVRMAISTSMKLSPEVAKQFHDKFERWPQEAYGIIEVGLPFINTESDTIGENTVGQALPDYELRIANADTDGVGEVLIKGKGMFDAYFSPFRTRSESTDDGWFHTGDLGRVDDDGRLYLLGRSKTVIVCAGMKVFPEEVEHVINAVPEVQLSLVTGRDHPPFGQVPVAQVVLKPNVEATDELLASIRAQCQEQLSSYKAPVEVRVVEDLPKTPSGKLIRAPS